MQRFTHVLIFLVGSCLSALAQTGGLRGTITDAKTKEPVIGASVRIDGTLLGAQTDASGQFSVGQVPAGTHKILISYISYRSKQIPGVRVESGNTTQLETEIEEESSTLSEVVVRGSRATNTEVAVISEIKQFKPMAVGISALQIQKSQDRDAAAAIRRVPGISIVDNRFVLVRGLASRYNTVMVNDMITPSTEVDVRSFSFDLIPSNILDRMIVFKTGAAELPGDFAGGVIKIYTKRRPDRNFFDAGLTFGYRAGTTFGQTQTHDRGPLAALGLWNTQSQIPTSFPATAAAFNDLSPQARAAYARLLPNTWGLEQIRVLPDLRMALNTGRIFDLGGVRVSNLTSINYSNTNQRADIALNTFNSGNLANDVAQQFTDHSFQQNTRIGILHNWSARFSPRFTLEWRNLFNQLGNTETIVRQGQLLDQAQDVQAYSQRFENRSILTSQLAGQHQLGPELKLDWMGAFGYTGRWEPDWKRIRYIRPQGASAPLSASIPLAPSPLEAGRFWSKLHEYVYSGSVNVEKALGNPADREPARLRAGAYFEQKNRDFNARFYGYRGAGNTQALDRLPVGQIFAPAHVQGSSGDAAQGGSFTLLDGTKVIDSYTATNTYAAAYAGGDVLLGRRLTLTLGLRGEYNLRKLGNLLNATLVNQGVFSPLPSANLIYKATDKQNLRLAYASTVNRPEFREQAPFSYYDFALNADIRGNQTLQNAVIQNLDAKWEFFPTDGELLSLTAFYKRFSNPVETFLLPQANGLAYTFINTRSATNYGVELELRKSLAFTGSPFLKDLTLVANASFIRSSIELGSTVKAPDLGGVIQEFDIRDITDTRRPMAGQSPYLINAGLYYANASGWSANVLYNVAGPRIFAVGNNDNPTVYEMPRHTLDLNVSKNLTRRLELRLGIQDLLNQAVRLDQDYNRDGRIGRDVTSKTATADQQVRSFRRGSYSTLSLVYNFGRTILP